MADFNTGNIDLSIENTFDNVDMGNGDTMDFINTGSGGANPVPILVTGDFIVAGTAIITLRNNANLTPGTVTVLGVSRDLDATTVVPGAGGSSGSRGAVGSGAGGGGGAGIAGTDGQDASYDPVTAPGGAGGTYPSGNGSDGGSDPNSADFCGGGGGGGGAGTPGNSCESVAFYVQGDVIITGGTINGVGTNASGNGGAGGAGGYGGLSINSSGGGGGGGGGGGSGGHGGNLYLFHIGAASEAFNTKNLGGGTATNGGSGGSGGGAPNGAPGGSGGTGGNGNIGTTGIVELIDVDTIPTITTDFVTEIFALQAIVTGSIVSNGGNAITERGFVVSTNPNPTTADTKFIVSGLTTPYSETITSLSADTTYHVRAYAINGNGTAYGADLEFKTRKAFVPISSSGG